MPDLTRSATLAWPEGHHSWEGAVNETPDSTPGPASVLTISPAPQHEADPEFTEFWAAYPRKVGRASGQRAWRAALRAGAFPKQIIAGAERFRDECRARGTASNYIPYPARWLNDGRYADESADAPRNSITLPGAAQADSLNTEQLLALVIRLSGDQARPVTSAKMIIDAVRLHVRPDDLGPAIAPSAERERELAAMPYREYLETPEWQARRKAALKQAGYRCQVCNRSRELHVHHRTYERRGAELPGDLTVLCDECHALYHGKGLVADKPA